MLGAWPEPLKRNVVVIGKGPQRVANTSLISFPFRRQLFEDAVSRRLLKTRANHRPELNLCAGNKP